MNLLELANLFGASMPVVTSGLDSDIYNRIAEMRPSGFAIDSRKVKPGDLFIAVPGENVDGHSFVKNAFEGGAAAALVVHKRLPFASDLSVLGDNASRLMFTADTVGACQRLCSRVIESWRRRFTGITASAGKTTMKELTAHVLSAAGPVLKSPGNLNTVFGLTLTISKMITGDRKPSDYDYAVFEMGMNSYGEISDLTDITNPAVGIVGNVGTAHMEYFGSIEAVAKAKSEMVKGIALGGTAVLNADDPLVIDMRNLRSDLSIITFGLNGPDIDIKADSIKVEDNLGGTRFMLHTPDGSSEVLLPLIGKHNIYNALAAASAAYSFGLSTQQIAEKLSTSSPAPMRGEIIRFSHDLTVIDDSYNSNPQALLEAVRSMVDAGGFNKKIVVAGEMLELGHASQSLHRECGKEIAALNVDYLIGVRGDAEYLAKGALTGGMSKDHVRFFETPDDAAASLSEIIADSSTSLVLIKGSRGVRMERIIDYLKVSSSRFQVSRNQ